MHINQHLERFFMNPKVVPPVFLLCLVALLFTPVEASGSDIAKERRWAEQIEDSLLDGDVVWLDDGTGQEFLGILTEGDTDSGRALLLVHGIGVHPNWPDVIYPLRAGLLEESITSLSIQMPILANEADAGEYKPLFAEVPGRIDASITKLEEAGYRSITLVAHSMGATMALYYQAQVPSSRIDSLIIIGTSPGLDGTENIDRLRQLKLPVLDLYGEADLEAVLASAAERATAGEASTSAFRQQRVTAANHFFQGQEAALVESVLQWLAAQSGP
jgi:pimeloyl-ACP methyl ester carboxylesterase